MSDMKVDQCPFQALPAYPFRRDTTRPFDLAREVSELRHERPIGKVQLYDGKEAWLITRLDDVRAVLRDDRFSSSTHHDNFPMWSPGIAKMKTTNVNFLRKDKPVHTAERNLWRPFFLPSNVAALRPAVQQFADEAIDELMEAGSPGDLVYHVALSVPAHVISKLLAVPDKDRAFLQKIAVTRLSLESTQQQVEAALADVHAYWLKLIGERLANPGDDLVSKLIVTEVKPGRISTDGLADMATLVLLAGFGTTADTIGLGALTLLQDPQLFARLRADPSCTLGFVEELLRYTSIAQHGLPRVATVDIELADVIIRKGDGVIVHVAAANRDEKHFPEPEKFDEGRQALSHAAFGAGIHACIGAPLARAELQIVFDSMLRRLPQLRLAVPCDQLKFKTDGLFFGIEELPVAWH